jgi:hypothetical protein
MAACQETQAGTLNRRSTDQPLVSALDLQCINLQLASLGKPVCRLGSDESYLAIAESLLKQYTQQRRLLVEYRSPPDRRIEEFLNTWLGEQGIDEPVSLPQASFILDQPGLARVLSLPLESPEFHSAYVDSYRLLQGVLHNPRHDRRTTSGVFHIAAGGFPVPDDKREVPAAVFASLLRVALDPPEDLLCLPVTAAQPDSAAVWTSLLVRPTVRPEVAGVLPPKSMEIRVFAPGGLVANLDFIETIFGNAGDPHLPENDAALDIDHWTGHSGCIILAPHLTGLRKAEVGLPHYDEASARQRRDGMFWRDADERYNDGKPFKLVCRDHRGVIVTLIADNYFGYSKKEIKSQISYSANLFGGCEEEHAGGALACPAWNLGESFQPGSLVPMEGHSFARVCEQQAAVLDVQDAGYAIDRNHPEILYVPEDTRIDLLEQHVSWTCAGVPQSLKLLAGKTYVYPNGYRVHLEKHPHAPSWRLIGTAAEGTFCHKPSTVSGGGKSEISKSIAGALISGPVYVGDFDADMDRVEEIFRHDYSDRFRDAGSSEGECRPLLSRKRSLGSVIKLLTASESEYSDAYNAWLAQIPQHILALVFMIKRFYKPEWRDDWRGHFSVDRVNGYPGHELKYCGRKLVASYLRVGFESDGSWRVFKLRQDFAVAEKLQMEDDISASTVIPVHYVQGLNPAYDNPCVKLVDNCELRLFQRPDEAINRGMDQQTEADLSTRNNFISNFEPLSAGYARELVSDAIDFEEFSAPMQQLIRAAAQLEGEHYFVSSAHPRLVDGKPSPNVRYLQQRPDLADPRQRYLAETATRLARGLSADQPVYFPVNAVLTGRRNNPPDPERGVRPLAVYNPVHYQELPELFMDYICSLTGKSPSTTGAGSEGALTKGPFNSLQTTADLNTALVSFILCGYDGFSTAAGHIGSQRRIDHDISMLIPEIWCRMPVAERNPRFMVAQGWLERMEDFSYGGRTVFASRLGYRITAHFVRACFAKVFDNPAAVLDEAMLRPESQDMAAFVDGIDNICAAHKRVAQGYFRDGSIQDACPPLAALLHIMADGHYQGQGIDAPQVRSLFTADYLLQSDWYRERLALKQARDVQLWHKHRYYLLQQLAETSVSEADLRAELEARIREVERMLQVVSNPDYLERLRGTLGADRVHCG